MNRKERILSSAAEIISETGIHALSTKNLAAHADVSEALIFKHYGSMEQLIHSLLMHCKKAIDTQLDLLPADDAKVFLKHCMEWPLVMPEKELWPWKCYYRCIWNGASAPSDMLQNYQERIMQSFEQISMANSETESQLMMSYMHGFFYSRLNGHFVDKPLVLSILRKRYT